MQRRAVLGAQTSIEADDVTAKGLHDRVHVSSSIGSIDSVKGGECLRGAVPAPRAVAQPSRVLCWGRRWSRSDRGRASHCGDLRASPG